MVLPMTNRMRIPVWAGYLLLLALAWSVRFAYLLETSDHPAFRLPLVDAGEYHSIARAWSAGQRPLEKLAWQPWFYPLALAQLYQVTGPSVWAAKLLQITVGSATCLLVAALAFALWPRPAVRWTAGLIAALYGPMIHYDGELLAEPWAALALVAAALAAVRYRQQPRDLPALALGALGGLLLFIRPPAMAGWLALVAWAAWHSSRLPAHAGRSPRLHLALLAAGFVLAAWPFVHAVQVGTGTARLLPVTGGINLYIGNSSHPCETLNIRPGYAWDNLTLLPELHGARTDDEKDAFFKALAWRDIRATPGVFVRNLVAKARQFVCSREIPRNVDLYLFRSESLVLRSLAWKIHGFGFPFGLLAGFALLGIWTRRPQSFGLLAAIGAYAAAIIAVHVCDRYRIPVLPLFIVLASFGVWTLIDSVQSRQFRRVTAQSGLLLLMGAATSLGTPFCAETLDYRPELFRLIATAADEHHDFALAQLYARKAVEENPLDAQAWNQLGLLDARQGNLDAAEALFRHAVDVDPACGPAWFNLGKAATKQGRTDEAIRLFREGLRRCPAQLPAWIDLGDLHMTLHQTGEAMACYQEVLRIRPDFPPALRRIASIPLTLRAPGSPAAPTPLRPIPLP